MRVIIFGNKITVDMRKNYISFLVIGLVLLFSGCVKDQRIDALKLVAEGGRNSERKMIITDEYSDWAAGDEVRINGTIVNVELIDGAAYVSGGDFEAPFYGVYPASIYRSNNGSSYTVNVPGTYTYSATEGKQLLQSPMAGHAESGNYVLFRHLTSAVTVQITNYYGFTVIVDSVIVISNSYKLHGDITFSLGEDISIPATEKVGGDTVVMLGGGLQVVSGNTVNVQVPVLPQGSGNLFTIQVKVHKYNNSDVKRRFDSTQPNSHPLARNQIGYAPMAVGYPFTVGNGKRVIIAQGNLQYQASTRTWQFAANQYDYIGDAAGNTTPEAERATQSAWIDLFGWGTSGWKNGNVYYQPYNTATTGVDTNGYGYGPTNDSRYTYSLTGAYANADWGVYNSIANGGNVAGRWRTPQSLEFGQIFKHRSASTLNGVANALYAKATVNGVNGVVVFPDVYEHPAGVALPTSINATGSGGWDGNVYSASEWAKMEAAGCVFMPITARINNGEVVATAYGCYWSSTVGSTQGHAFYVLFSSANFYYNSTSCYRNYGQAVRLVQDIP